VPESAWSLLSVVGVKLFSMLSALPLAYGIYPRLVWNNQIWFIWNRVDMGRYRFQLVVLRSGFKIDGEMGWF
jgi:hypothetical protein